MGCYVLLSVVSSPTPSPPPPCAPFHFPAAMFIRIRGTSVSPPHHTPISLDKFEATTADLEDGH
jgi:hypothetical protein